MSYFRKISLITVCFDRWEQLQRTWPTWTRLDYPEIEHIVVVAGPDERPVAISQDDDFNGLIVRVRNTEHYRPSYLRNLGACASSGEFLAFIDADIFIHPNWLSACLSELKARCDLVIHSATSTGQDAGGESGTLVIARWIFEKIRGYSENLDDRWGYEDTDLIVRAQRAGGRAGMYYATMISGHIDHSDEERTRHIRHKDAARLPMTYLRQMKVAETDAELHPFEANRIRRLRFSPDVITKIDRRE